MSGEVYYEPNVSLPYLSNPWDFCSLPPPFHLFTSRGWETEHTSYSSAPQPRQAYCSILYCTNSEVRQNVCTDKWTKGSSYYSTHCNEEKVECPPNVVSTYLWQEGSRRGRKARGGQSASSAISIPPSRWTLKSWFLFLARIICEWIWSLCAGELWWKRLLELWWHDQTSLDIGASNAAISIDRFSVLLFAWLSSFFSRGLNNV